MFELQLEPSLSTPPHRRVAGLAGRGGGRPTTYLTQRQAQAHLAAARFAEHEGMRLNTFIAVCWRHRVVGTGSERLKERGRLRCPDYWPVLTACREALVKHLRRSGWPVAFLWVQERKPGAGLHWHVALHLPGRGDALAEARRSVQRLLERVGCFQPEGKGVVLRRSTTRKARAGLKQYLLKGLAPLSFAKILGVRTSCQGRIPGKRSGVAQALGAAARRLTGYAPGKDTPQEQAAWLRSMVGQPPRRDNTEL
jgi:hypothetical protein